MLTPDYLDHCADYLLGMYDELDRDIIADIARRIVKTSGITLTAKYQIDVVQQSGMLLSEVTKSVATVTGLSQNEVLHLFDEAGVIGLQNDAKPLILAGQKVDLNLSPAMRQALEAAISKTNSDLRNLTLTTGVTATNKYMEAVNSAYMKVQSGAFPYQQAIRSAVKAAVSDGNWVSYLSGHRSRLDVAIRRSLLTGLNQTAARQTEMFASDIGCEYYETTAHAGARPSHAIWQGRIFKINGSTAEYPNFVDATGYGTGDGICGWNCRHGFYPFFMGISVPAHTQKMLDAYNAPRFVINGETLTEYDVTQLMREHERNIRQTKRELAGYQAAVDSATNRELKTILQQDFDSVSLRLKTQESIYKDLCKQTKHKSDSTRTGVFAIRDSNGDIISFSRSTAQRARYGAKRAS